MDLTKPNVHWLYNTRYKGKYERAFSLPTIALGLNSEVDMQHMWSIFTMYWPQIAFAALIGRE